MSTKAREVYDQLMSVVDELGTSLVEFEDGKKVAAVRVRKLAQEGKKLLQDVRIETMAMLKAMPVRKRGE